MTPGIIITFDHAMPYLEPESVIHGTYRFVDVRIQEIARVEFSVLWFTEGKGDEDLGVHHFERLGADDEAFSRFRDGFNDSQTFAFHVPLPRSPLSYYGKILKIRWCVRVRLYFKSGREINSEKPFALGNLPPVEVELN
ncbi:MAG: hypothetical protein Q4D98_13895 [Planctomycetia bacterium]|nr:hypothetical protein [Planctomycetia bacterium]